MSISADLYMATLLLSPSIKCFNFFLLLFTFQYSTDLKVLIWLWSLTWRKELLHVQGKMTLLPKIRARKLYHKMLVLMTILWYCNEFVGHALPNIVSTCQRKIQLGATKCKLIVLHNGSIFPRKRWELRNSYGATFRGRPTCTSVLHIGSWALSCWCQYFPFDTWGS